MGKQGGNYTSLLSVSDTTGCCGFTACFNSGCFAGHIASAWSWFDKTGVVTGGDFGDKSTCYPYTMPQCLQMGEQDNATGLPECSQVRRVAPKCSKSCSTGDGRD